MDAVNVVKLLERGGMWHAKIMSGPLLEETVRLFETDLLPLPYSGWMTREIVRAKLLASMGADGPVEVID